MLKNDVFFKKVTQQCKEKDKENYGTIYIESINIISKLKVKDERELFVSHYTRKDVLEKLLFDK